MNKVIKIGFLFPYSSIHPNMSNDIMDGFFAALPAAYRRYYQFYPEFIDQGGSEPVKAAINKMRMFHQVDILSGFVSYMLLPEILPLISKKDQLCFFFDMGEYLPPLYPLPENCFFNSFQFWQLEYALGNWAQKRFGGKGAMLMSIYDSGYHIHSSFWQGAIFAGAQEIDMHIVPYNPQMPDIKDVLPDYLSRIEKSGVDYLHALFCGNEALSFFSMYKQSGLHNKIPLLVSPHMASDVVLSKISHLGLGFYSASGWNYQLNTTQNILFKRQFEQSTGRKSTVFAVMGYEMGLALLPTLPQMQKGDIESAISYLKTSWIDGPRGKRNFSIQHNFEKPDVEIEKISLQSTQYTEMVMEQGTPMEYNHLVFEDIHSQCVSGWKNPYLCV
ncbi:ABC-type branched-chain amino acid transport systems periplasmic component-like protein [Paludibacter propionicigenes WB4]|uniref:ABC-type branched-chain amino acid transport systems periplasmic component-like protein n=1 Tax=Paludibacter propionicigenes (strain DSM 17365 / JCM 13257 / WB4) TaxID=694427 RepID=E4T6C0_PALPW|nr:ABC transporter substrate-binding protein [Paludibacter propionicigenes]ADQ80264.1 ABC-type branched-chain amino acid transport systems periplasmic component-like protein [Paludibacter propionicigenes WB4]